MTHLLIQGDAGPRSPILARHVTAPATRNTYPPISASNRLDEAKRAVAGTNLFVIRSNVLLEVLSMAKVPAIVPVSDLRQRTRGRRLEEREEFE